MKVVFNALNFLITDACPVGCSHCAVAKHGSSLGQSDLLAVLEVAAERGCKLINFSGGGEPFVYPGLEAMVEAASAAGFITRITTSAFWASSLQRARSRLSPLVAVGLDQLFISCSDGHLLSIPWRNVIHASTAAAQCGIETYIYALVTKRSRTSARTIRQAFLDAGESLPFIVEAPVIPFGGATTMQAEILLRPIEDIDGPCHSFTLHPTIHPDGTVVGCGGVFARDYDLLNFGNIHQDSMRTIALRMEQSPIAAWLSACGIVRLKEFVESVGGPRFADSYANMCHLCGEMLADPGAIRVLQAHGFGGGPR